MEQRYSKSSKRRLIELKEANIGFIDSKIADIDAGKFTANPTAGVNRQDFNKLMGFSFERWCRRHESLFARHMKFGGGGDYLHGAWFERSAAQTQGLQIDLMYIRRDSKIIVCEIKCNSDAPVTAKSSRKSRKRSIASSPIIRSTGATRSKRR